ncbi:hypothetical protein GQ44DRAFT_769511 [Phaeosphaeriaceae sp. PMI808]|nr:hypothetical protein GQ44DRAFT_769511 [Phaeosphaeriaceae sp. PMI808]
MLMPPSSADLMLTEEKQSLGLVDMLQQGHAKFDKFADATGLKKYWELVHLLHNSLVSAYVITKHQHQHEKLVARLFEILEENELICKTNDGGFVRTEKSVRSTMSQVLQNMIVSRFPDFAQQHRLLRITGERLASCLTGGTNGKSNLFGTNAARELLEDVYTNAPMFKTATYLLRSLLTSIYSSYDQRETVEILEIGAGLGGTTKFVVEGLLGAGINFTYTFSDVSDSLVFKAKHKFKHIKQMRYHTIDNENDVSPRLVAQQVIFGKDREAFENSGINLRNEEELMEEWRQALSQFC